MVAMLPQRHAIALEPRSEDVDGTLPDRPPPNDLHLSIGGTVATKFRPGAPV